MSYELGRLTQGNDAGVKFNDRFDFIHQRDVQNDRKVTYVNFVWDYRPLKSDQYRILFVVGEEKLYHTLDAGSPAASMLENKLLVNSMILDSK